MVYKGACPRCSGDLFTREDEDGRYLFCPECWWAGDVENYQEDLDSRNGNHGNSAYIHFPYPSA